MDAKIIDTLTKVGIITTICVDASKYDSIDDLINDGVITIPGIKNYVLEVLKDTDIEIEPAVETKDEETKIEPVVETKDEETKIEPVTETKDEETKIEPVVETVETVETSKEISKKKK